MCCSPDPPLITTTTTADNRHGRRCAVQVRYAELSAEVKACSAELKRRQDAAVAAAAAAAAAAEAEAELLEAPGT
eukprot:363029-Chlamydomonas_euryale.AAC.11